MHTALITDAGSPDYDYNREYFAGIMEWAAKHCPSFAGIEIQDVSDVSHVWDEIASYKFTDEKDYVMFMLRWK